MGVGAALFIEGGATLRVGETTIHLPRGRGVAIDLLGWHGEREVPKRRHISWAGSSEQHTRTMVLLWSNPGYLRPIPCPPPERLHPDVQAERADNAAAEREEAAEQGGDESDLDAKTVEGADDRLQDDDPAGARDATGETVPFRQHSGGTGLYEGMAGLRHRKAGQRSRRVVDPHLGRADLALGKVGSAQRKGGPALWSSSERRGVSPVCQRLSGGGPQSFTEI